MTLSKLIKNFLDGQELPKQNKIKPKPVPKVDPKLIFQISAIGNNMNQISRKVNENQKFDVILELVSIEAQLERLLSAYKIY